ncbi:MAG: 7-carboxy-7-deazaguanine synthase QueE [Candidatus Omnitrophica bacterium CG07_land_8_20_14_0_80_42_15]|uniref:7-carboxy-7-deazaguanine synthase n=1 Tax=Candidatus Aquitaenariimonas noxiae TaxID=1974741 RepID=A0A2J0KQD3_9BACT|nr:MAG: 7-carboxy-7-deazaguanine synthase QueE [Candidatus Omnitrophica bacterium CG07_land_8_20_14_0_80_42_15]
MEKAKISEVFYSIQGEGVYAGIKQVFVRFYGCNLGSCRFCDTRISSYKEYYAKDLLDEIVHFNDDYHSISITGGEPLVQKKFLKEFLLALKVIGKKVYLETNGTMPGALREIIDYVDIIAMDFKLPSATRLRDFWREHAEFLNIALAKEVFVKAVVTADTLEDDIKVMRDIIAEINPKVVLVLQPVTYINGAREPEAGKLARFQDACLDKLEAVEIIPQIHRLAGIR